LMNKKYQNIIDEIIITAQGKTLILKKNNLKYWEGKDNNIVFPVDSDLVKRFIQLLIKTRNLYTVSYSSKKEKLFNVDEQSAILIQYKINGILSTKIYFGKKSIDQSRQYFRTDRTISIYEISDDLDPYLTNEIEYWCDPYLIPQNIYGKTELDDIQRIAVITKEGNIKTYLSGSELFNETAERLLELRHGKIIQLQTCIKEELKLMIERGDGKQITLCFTLKTADTVLVTYSFKSTTIQMGTITGKYTYCTEISVWTYNQIINLLSKF